MRCQQICCLFYLIITWSIPTGICRSCSNAKTDCEIGQTCWLYPPPNVTLKNSKFSLIRTNTNTTTPINIIHQNGTFTFTPTETIGATRIVADFTNAMNKTICSSTLIILAKPLPVTRVSCNVQRKQQNNDISCKILENITGKVVKVEIFPRNTEETKECILNKTDLVFRCSFDYKNRFLKHNISITVSNEVNNTQPAVNHIYLYIFNNVEPKYLHNVTLINDGCFSMNITAQPDDPYIPLNNTPLLFYLVITAKDIIIPHETVIGNRTLIYNMKNKFFGNYNYNISIKWKPLNGTKWSKVSSHLQRTDICVPSGAPVVFKGGYSITTKNTIAVYWKKIPKVYENGPDLEYEISRIQDKKPVEKKIVNGSRVSVLMAGSQQENEVLIIAKNKKGSSQEKSSIKIPNQDRVKDRPSSLKFDPLNATHHRLSWTYSSFESAHDELHFFWCYGIYRRSSNWVECKQDIYNQTVRNSSSTLSSSFYDVLKPGEPEEFCNNCSWNYGLSVIHEDIASPIVWDKTEIRIPSDNLTIVTIVYLTIFIVIAILFIVCCIVYRCKRSKKRCCGTYDIITPPLSEFYEMNKMSTYTTGYNQFGPYLQQSEANGNITADSCDTCNENVDDSQGEDRPVIIIDVDGNTTNQTYYTAQLQPD